MRTLHMLANACASTERAQEGSASFGALLATLQAIQRMFSYPFMQNALLAGTIVALVAGVVGYVMVLRGESFAGHALANIGFAGAAGAALVGVPVVAGLIGVGVLGAFGIGALEERTVSRRGRRDVAVGAVLAAALGLGVLFERLSSAKATSIYAILFGSTLGVSAADLRYIALTAMASLLAMALIARPLLFASLDPAVAGARGTPVRLLSYGFLVLLALSVAQAVQVVGVLLVFSLLVAPAAAAQRLTARIGRGVALSVLLALLATWSGLIAAYFSPYPAGFFITTFAFAAYLLARLAQTVRGRLTRPGANAAHMSGAAMAQEAQV